MNARELAQIPARPEGPEGREDPEFRLLDPR
jgi:hypothetical protein